MKNKVDYQATIIGKGILKSKLKNYILKNKLSKNVKLINFVKNPFCFIKQADLFVLSSRYEGLPNVLLEALVLKKFIISSNCPTGPNEILDRGNNGILFKTGSYKLLAKKIIEYSKNKKRFRKKIYNSYGTLNRYNFNVKLDEYFIQIKRFF